MNKLERIHTFIRVVEEGSFASAGRRLYLSKAAVSRQITALEADLGSQLLKRTTRQISLTGIGQEYYRACKATLSELAEAEQVIASNQKEALGVLRVTSTRSFAFTYILPFLPKFLKANPKLKVILEIAERFPDLAAENIDILFGVSASGPAELVRRSIATTRYVLCASPGYLKTHGTPLTPTDLKQHVYITHSGRKPVDILTFKGEKELYIEPALLINDIQAMRECVIRGLGIAKLQEYEIDDALKDGRLIEVLKEYRTPSYPVFLYYQQTKYLPAKIRRFIDYFLGEMGVE